MANTLTSVTESMLQDEVLPALKLGLVPIDAFSYAVAETPKAVGDSVTVPVVTAKTAGTYSTTFESGNSTVTGTSVTLAAPTFSSWFVNPNLEAAPTIQRWMACAREAAYAVAKSVLQSTIALFVEGNIGSTENTDELVVTAANYDVDDQATLWGMLKTKGVTGQVSAIHTIDYAARLLKDNTLQDRSASGSDVLQTAEFPPILGARQFYTDAFPSAVTTQNTGVIYTGRQTAAVAMAIPNVVDSDLQNAAGLRVMVTADPDTGIPLIYRSWVNTATGAFWGSVLIMHGQSFVQDAAVRVVSA